MKTYKRKHLIQRNIWVTIDNVYVTLQVSPARITILNRRYLTKAGMRYVMQQAARYNPKAYIV